jgi:hypothetical protein
MNKFLKSAILSLLTVFLATTVVYGFGNAGSSGGSQPVEQFWTYVNSLIQPNPLNTVVSIPNFSGGTITSTTLSGATANIGTLNATQINTGGLKVTSVFTGSNIAFNLGNDANGDIYTRSGGLLTRFPICANDLIIKSVNGTGWACSADATGTAGGTGADAAVRLNDFPNAGQIATQTGYFVRANAGGTGFDLMQIATATGADAGVRLSDFPNAGQIATQTGYFLRANVGGTGFDLTSTTATPAGADTQIQTNSGGSFAGNYNLTFTPSTNVFKTVTISGSTIQANVIDSSNGNFGTLTGSVIIGTTLSGTTINAGTINSSSSNTGIFSGSTANLNTINSTNGNFGTLTGSTIFGIIGTAIQSTITTIGNLLSLWVSGNVGITGNLTLTGSLITTSSLATNFTSSCNDVRYVTYDEYVTNTGQILGISGTGNFVLANTTTGSLARTAFGVALENGSGANKPVCLNGLIRSSFYNNIFTATGQTVYLGSGKTLTVDPTTLSTAGDVIQPIGFTWVGGANTFYFSPSLSTVIK